MKKHVLYGSTRHCGDNTLHEPHQWGSEYGSGYVPFCVGTGYPIEEFTKGDAYRPSMIRWVSHETCGDGTVYHCMMEHCFNPTCEECSCPTEGRSFDEHEGIRSEDILKLYPYR